MIEFILVCKDEELEITNKINEIIEVVNRLEQGEKQPETTPVTETEYIDKGKVFDAMYDLLHNDTILPTKQDILAVIENAPAEDVEKVIHGEWLIDEIKKQNRKFFICSKCGAGIDSAVCQIDENEFDFCPYCNAKMDLKGGA